MHAGLEGVVAVGVGAVKVLEAVAPPADVERVAVGHIGQAAELADVAADLARPVGTQVGQVAGFAEIELYGGELVLKGDALKAGGLHKPVQLLR